MCIRDRLSSLGGQEEKPAPAPSGGPDLSALLGALGGGQASPPPAEPALTLENVWFRYRRGEDEVEMCIRDSNTCDHAKEPVVMLKI